MVVQALIITCGVFFALSLYTLQSKYDFSGLAPFLYAGLWILILSGFIHIFIPFSKGTDFLIAIAGAAIFCGYIIFDTYMIAQRVSPDEYVMASIELYLDFVNLFLYILRILAHLSDRN